jgi:hypothetical protein
VILESGCTALQESQLCVRNKIRDFLQRIDVLVPFRPLRNAPHRFRPPGSRSVGYGSKKLPFFPNARTDMGEVAGSEDWKERKTWWPSGRGDKETYQSPVMGPISVEFLLSEGDWWTVFLFEDLTCGDD